MEIKKSQGAGQSRFDIKVPGQPQQGETNRAQRRKQLRPKHHPEFTKKFSSERAGTKAEAKEIQLRAIASRLAKRGVLDEMKWSVLPKYILEMKRYRREWMERFAGESKRAEVSGVPDGYEAAVDEG